MIISVKEVGNPENDSVLEILCVHEDDTQRTENTYRVFCPSNVTVVSHVSGALEFMEDGTISDVSWISEDIAECFAVWNIMRCGEAKPYVIKQSER